MKRSIELACGAVAALALFGIMALTFFDVIGRKLLDNSIPGSLELTELMMVLVIFAALPLVSQRREHVTFDSLDSVLPEGLRRLQIHLVNLLAVAVFVGVGYLMVKHGLKFMEQGDTTAQLQIKKAPFVFAMAFFLWSCALVHLGQLVTGFLRADQADQDTDGEGSAL
jgi:TRAP-type transport system small permease protein